jgi:hypothetical protein
MPLSLRELMPPGATSLRDLQLLTQIPDSDIRRQASRILINRHHALLGGLTGRIGLPMGELRPSENGGFVRPYSGGSIELFDFANGPKGIQKFRAEIRFVGYRVVDTNDASADEPYFIIGVTGNNPGTNVVVRTNIAEASVKADNNVFLEQTITTIAQPPFVLSVTGMDHDAGEPDEAAAKVSKALNDAAARLTLALPLLGVSPDVGAYIQSFLNIFGGEAGTVISALFGMGDDTVGQNALQFFEYDPVKEQWNTPKAMQHADFDREHNVELALNNGEGGGYIAFFNVQLFNDVSTPVVPDN